jgi:hypothetical protein
MRVKTIGAVVCLAWSAGAPAQDQAEIAALRAQLEAHKEQIRALEARLEALERKAPPPKPAPAAATQRPQVRVGGYADLTTIYRSTFSGAGISTAFGSIPLAGTPEGRLGEFRASAGHSRLSFRLDTQLGGRDLATYIETDFLAAPQGNVFNGSNAHPLRLRLYWVQWQSKHWELLGGQSWSLLAPNRQGISPAPADVMNTHLIDPNYSVGLVWTRQATLRVTRRWQRFSLAAAAENAEQLVLDSRAAPAGAPGLATRAVPGANLLPDVVVKLSFDTPVAHLEAAAIGRSFRVLLGDRRYHAAGGGLSLAGVIHAGERVDLVSQSFVSSGGGR